MKLNFTIVTPVRNEEKYIRKTIECMLSQTLLPVKWIIVDDGSSDNTGKIISEYTHEEFIEYIYIKDRGYRKPGAGVMETFYVGVSRLSGERFDVISKFDGDLDFPPFLLENISDAFISNPTLGITGPTRYEKKNEQAKLKKVNVPDGFVGGPFKFYRQECFDDIGGPIVRAGWDGVDTIKANIFGWDTGEIDDLHVIHMKTTGMSAGEGLKRSSLKYGDVSYYMGGYFWYFLLRVAYRSITNLSAAVGYYMLSGYFKSMRMKLPREDKNFRRFLRKQQVKNTFNF